MFKLTIQSVCSKLVQRFEATIWNVSKKGSCPDPLDLPLDARLFTQLFQEKLPHPPNRTFTPTYEIQMIYLIPNQFIWPTSLAYNLAQNSRNFPCLVNYFFQWMGSHHEFVSFYPIRARFSEARGFELIVC